MEIDLNQAGSLPDASDSLRRASTGSAPIHFSQRSKPGVEGNRRVRSTAPSLAIATVVLLTLVFIPHPSLAGEPLLLETDAPSVSATTGFSYDFVDLDYSYSDFDSPHLDKGHGAGVKFSKSLSGALLVLGGFQYDHGDYDGVPGSWDNYGAHAGLGTHFAVTERLDLTFDLVANHRWTDGGAQGDDSWGLATGPGLRFAVVPGLELFGTVGYRFDFEGSADLWDYRAGAVFDIADSVGLRIGGFVNKEAAGGFAGIRIYY